MSEFRGPFGEYDYDQILCPVWLFNEQPYRMAAKATSRCYRRYRCIHIHGNLPKNAVNLVSIGSSVLVEAGSITMEKGLMCMDPNANDHLKILCPCPACLFNEQPHRKAANATWQCYRCKCCFSVRSYLPSSYDNWISDWNGMGSNALNIFPGPYLVNNYDGMAANANMFDGMMNHGRCNRSRENNAKVEVKEVMTQVDEDITKTPLCDVSDQSQAYGKQTKVLEKMKSIAARISRENNGKVEVKEAMTQVDIVRDVTETALPDVSLQSQIYGIISRVLAEMKSIADRISRENNGKMEVKEAIKQMDIVEDITETALSDISDQSQGFRKLTKVLEEMKSIAARISRENNCKAEVKEVMTQTDIETVLSDFAKQTNCVVDIHNAHRGEPDGKSSSNSTTHVKTVRDTDTQSDCDSTTHIKELNTISDDCRQCYTKGWIDSLEDLIGSYLDASHNDIDIRSQNSTSAESEICNADQISSEDEEHNNGYQTSNAVFKTCMSIDSNDMFGD